MDGKGGKNWTQRSKALQHFRRTVGMEPSSGVRVNVIQQTAVVNSDRPRSFEEAMTRVRREHAKAEQDAAVSFSDELLRQQGSNSLRYCWNPRFRTPPLS